MAKKSPFEIKVSKAMREVKSSGMIDNIYENLDQALGSAGEVMSIDQEDPEYDEVTMEVNRRILTEYLRDTQAGVGDDDEG